MIQIVFIGDVGHPMNLDTQVSGQIGPDILDVLTERTNMLTNRHRRLIGRRRWYDSLLGLYVIN